MAQSRGGYVCYSFEAFLADITVEVNMFIAVSITATDVDSPLLENVYAYVHPHVHTCTCGCNCESTCSLTHPSMCTHTCDNAQTRIHDCKHVPLR